MPSSPWLRFVGFAGLVIALGACGDDDDDGKAAPAAAGDGGVTPGDPTAPGIAAKDCPGTPANLNLIKVAPVYNGLVSLELTVPGGVPDSLDVQVLDPASGDFRTNYGYGAPRQKGDGRFVVLASINVRESSKALEHKVRVRSKLTGCPPSGWAESPGFTVGDPIAGTTWKADIPVGLLDSNFYVNSKVGAGTTVGPYTVNGKPSSHTMSFAADGSFSETYQFTVTSLTTGDLYDNCTFNISFVGTWQLRILGDNTSLLISSRKLKPGGASTGSTCAAPPVAEMAMNQPSADIQLGAQSNFLNIDYTPLLDATPGKPFWQNNVANGFGNIFQGLSDVVGADTVNVSGNAYPQYAVHVRQ